MRNNLKVLVYMLRLDKVKENYDEYMTYITEKRRQQIQKMKYKNDRRASLGAGYLLYRYLGVETDADIETGLYGKPYLKSKATYFNISHSGEYVILAVADEEVGIDIESTQIVEVIKNVPSKAFTEDEKAWLANNPDEESFSILWTKKEAVLKADGQGFCRDPQSISVLDTTEFFIECKKIDDYIISCAMKKPFGMEFIFV